MRAPLPALFTILLLLALTGAASADEWEPAFGARLQVGGGGRIAPGDERGGLFELAPQLGMLLGSKNLAVGPLLEFRTANFNTAELTGGIGWAHTDNDFGLLGDFAAGYAWRASDANGAILTASLAYGLLTIGPPLVASTVLYVTFRHAATGPSRDEITAGISFGGGVWYDLFRIAHTD
jgi:hypothetical protein